MEQVKKTKTIATPPELEKVDVKERDQATQDLLDDTDDLLDEIEEVLEEEEEFIPLNAPKHPLEEWLEKLDQMTEEERQEHFIDICGCM
jgi:hypothetical protein